MAEDDFPDRWVAEFRYHSAGFRKSLQSFDGLKYGTAEVRPGLSFRLSDILQEVPEIETGRWGPGQRETHSLNSFWTF